MESNIQKKKLAIKDRVKILLETQKLADVRFRVGKPPKHKCYSAHKLILAMASPVFERMFYGDDPDESDIIEIPYLQPGAFKAVLEYIYSDRKKLQNLGEAYDLYCAAKKYMLTDLMETCIVYLQSKLKPSNACEAYEFAKYFQEVDLMETSMEVIVSYTKEVLEEPNFINVHPDTLMAILDEQRLNLDSELELFNALQRYADARVFSYVEAEKNKKGKAPQTKQQEINLLHLENLHLNEVSVENNLLSREIKTESEVHTSEEDEGMHSFTSNAGSEKDSSACELFPNNSELTNFSSNLVITTNTVLGICNTIPNDDATLTNVVDNTLVPDVTLTNQNCTILNANTNNANNISPEVNYYDFFNQPREPVSEEIIREAVKKIRFLTLTPIEFVEGPAVSKLLKQEEAFAILVNIIKPNNPKCCMPEGFLTY